jgi:flavin reductase (DIM6/NTAB) family NADH-FMN oxidoreductase RutF
MSMRREVEPESVYRKTLAALADTGLLLVSGEKGNPMAIGWATMGLLWSKPVFIVYVRPSRASHNLIETFGEFSVNVPDEKLREAVASCGSESGRDTDKAAKHGLTLVAGIAIKVPHILECPIHYECRLIHTGKVVADTLDRVVLCSYYLSDDFHSVFYGEILGAYSDL